MKRFLLTAVALLVFFCPLCSGQSDDLNVWYDEYNKEYFYNHLPHNVIIDYSQTGRYMALTTRMADGRFHIAFNEKYTAAERVARLILLHEQCHIKHWDAPDQEHDGHGREWRACMLELDAEGAFRVLLIDAYEEEL
jgi:hypothetical protein